MEKLVAPAKRRYPGVKFAHLNYAAGDNAAVRRAIRFSFACARLWDDSSYLVSPASSDEGNEVYSRDLGEPLGPAYSEDRTLGIAWREYPGGIVAVNSGVRAARIPGFGLELPDPPNGYVFPARG